MPWTATTYCGVAMLCDTRVFPLALRWLRPSSDAAAPCGRRAAFNGLLPPSTGKRRAG